MVSTRTTPRSRRIASTVASSPTNAPVCAAAVRAASSLRPALRTDRLHEDGDDSRLFVVDEEVQGVSSGHHGFVAESDQVAQLDTRRVGEFEHRARARAALRQQRDVPASGRQVRDRRDRDPIDEVRETEHVRPEDEHVELLSVSDELSLCLDAGRTGLGVSGAHHDRVADTRCCGFVEHVQGRRLRHHREREIDLLIDVGEARHCRPAVRAGIARVDQVQPVAEAEVVQVVDNELREIGLVGRTDDRDPARAEQPAQLLDARCALRPGHDAVVTSADVATAIRAAASAAAETGPVNLRNPCTSEPKSSRFTGIRARRRLSV